MSQTGRIVRVIFDECHTICMDRDWRQDMWKMADLFNEPTARIPRVFLTATLPQHAEKELQTMMMAREIPERSIERMTQSDGIRRKSENALMEFRSR